MLCKPENLNMDPQQRCQNPDKVAHTIIFGLWRGQRQAEFLGAHWTDSQAEMVNLGVSLRTYLNKIKRKAIERAT